MRGPFEHLLVARILDLRLGAMLRFLVATTMLAAISITILIIVTSCISSSEPTEATGANDSTNSHREGRVSSDEKPRADPPRCGQPVNTFSGRIVDGKIGSIAEFPWIVSLQREKSYWFGYKYYKHACGGSLITPSWIVTASHCFFNREYPKIVVAGTDNLDFLYRAQVRTVERVILHPRFEPATFNNDIALIKVNPPFNTDSSFSYVRPICFEPGIPVLPYDIATIAGFGAKSYKQQTTTRLYQTDIAIIDRDLCNRTFDGKITTNMICAGGMIPNKRDACSGDSGGPLQLEVEDHISLIGAVSFGNDCATKGFPGIYTKLNNYYAWVLSYLDEPLLDP